LPAGLDAWTHYEFSAWGAGHVLQVANTCAMLSIWLWLAARATGRPVLTPLAARIAFTVLLAPHFAMPLLTMRGSLNNLYHTGATQLMRWGIFPVVLVVLFLIVRHLLANRPVREPAARMAVAGFAASAGLTLLGFTLGAFIRSSTTLVPAHYHASLGAVTVSLMAAAFLTADRVACGDSGFGLLRSVWVRARRQIMLFGAGQTVFVLGFAIGGIYGLGRKAYAGEQHVRNAGEIAGLGVMGVGGLIAVVAGIWFLVLMLSEMRAWWRASVQPQPVLHQESK
jgi:cytochrome c oxidase subunit I